MRTLALTLLAALAFLFNSTSAQSPPTPPDVQLIVRTRTKQSTFHIGEVVPLELAFTSTSRDKYQLDTASYDRSGRLNEDKFFVEPSKGWDDPLELYYHSYLGLIGGGLRGSRILSPDPTTISLELNEWVRFKDPGQYRVKINSERVFGTRGNPEVRIYNIPSNELILTIIPATKEWQESSLRAAIETLDSPRTGTPVGKEADLRRDAVKVLRYLGSRGAVREMARRLIGSEWDWDFQAGLVGSRARSVAIEEMEKLLGEADFPVTDRFLDTMSVLALQEDEVDSLPAQREKAEAQFRQQLI